MLFCQSGSVDNPEANVRSCPGDGMRRIHGKQARIGRRFDVVWEVVPAEPETDLVLRAFDMLLENAPSLPTGGIFDKCSPPRDKLDKQPPIISGANQSH